MWMNDPTSQLGARNHGYEWLCCIMWLCPTNIQSYTTYKLQTPGEGIYWLQVLNILRSSSSNSLDLFRSWSSSCLWDVVKNKQSVPFQVSIFWCVKLRVYIVLWHGFLLLCLTKYHYCQRILHVFARKQFMFPPGKPPIFACPVAAGGG